MNKLQLSQADKELLKKTAEDIGAKADNIKAVWEYTIITSLLNIDPNAKLKRITLPYLGSIAIRLGNTYSASEDSEIVTQDMEPFISLNTQFKKLLEDASKGNYDELTSYLREKLLNYLD